MSEIVSAGSIKLDEPTIVEAGSIQLDATEPRQPSGVTRQYRREPSVFDETEWPQLKIPQGMLDENRADEATRIAATFDVNPSFAYIFSEQAKQGMENNGLSLHKKTFLSGIGATYENVGNVLKWQGYNDQAAVYSDFGKRLKKAYAFPHTDTSLTWKNLASNEFWATNITGNIPFSYH